MFIIKRNQVIVTALVVMIAVAGYLNFTETSQGESTASVMQTDSDAVLNAEGDGMYTLADNGEEDFTVAQGETDPITGEVVASAEEGSSEDDTGAAVFVNASAAPDTYFAQAKLEREQARAKQKDLLTEMINNGNVDQQQKAKCAESMMDIQKRIEKETAAEAMIESKGFKEAYVRIDDETVDVVVEKAELSDAETAQIMDIVKRKTGFSDDKIRISPLKK
ncbi:MAG: SpoIIIAH-like family protein [Clostridiales bacterium]|nr:SpoIIIAH-like family protein [Clostridiales bacterium]